MSHEDIYGTLAKNAKDIFDGLEKHLKDEAEKGYLKPIKNKYKEEDEEDESITFKMGSRKFLLIAHMFPQTGYTSFKTYELVRDGAVFGSWLTTHIPTLDIRMDVSKHARFNEEKIFKDKAMIGGFNERKTARISNFSKDYFHQLSNYIDDSHSSNE